MSLNRYATRRDANEPQIIEALEAAGATVFRLERPVDLLVGYRGRTLLLEVKRPLGPKGGEKDRTLTVAQRRFNARWAGDPVRIVRTPLEAVDALHRREP